MAENEKIYNEIRKKHNLPEYNDIEREFEISSIESEQLLRHIPLKIGEKLEFFTHLLEEVLQPEAMHAMHESRYLTEPQRKNLYELYKKIMFMNRQIAELSLVRSDKEDSQFIISFMAEWKSIKKELLEFVKMIKDSWKSEAEIDEKVRYVG